MKCCVALGQLSSFPNCSGITWLNPNNSKVLIPKSRKGEFLVLAQNLSMMCLRPCLCTSSSPYINPSPP